MHLPKRNWSGGVSVAPDSLNIKLLGIETSHLFQSVLCHGKLIMLLRSITVADGKMEPQKELNKILDRSVIV
jgi:hypothetical protein